MQSEELIRFSGYGHNLMTDSVWLYKQRYMGVKKEHVSPFSLLLSSPYEEQALVRKI